MKKCLLGALILICLVLFFFAVPPTLSMADTAMVLFGFLLLVVSLGGAIGGTILLTRELKE